jgi:hypothetical protein
MREGVSCTRRHNILPQNPTTTSPRIASTSSASPPSASTTTSSTLATPVPVRPSLPFLLSLSLCLPSHSLSRFLEVIYPSQGPRRWLLRHRMALRLARGPTPQYALVSHAVWQQLQARVGWKASCRRQAHEEKVGGWLGRVPEAQGDRGRFPFFILLDNRSPVSLSLSVLFRSTPTLFLSTTFFFSPTPRSSTLFSNPWRAISIT